MPRHYMNLANVDPQQLHFAVGQNRQGNTQVTCSYGPEVGELSFVTPPCITMWPRCTGDGNYGTMFGPSDASKAKYTLDLTDAPLAEGPNEQWALLAQTLEKIDDRLLDFVAENQVRLLGRKNLSRDELKMLQIRSVKPKYDKMSGQLNGHSLQLALSKYTWDGMGGKYARDVTVCDCTGAVLAGAQVAPGDFVAATAFVNSVYTGVGGDKFGISWGFGEVAVVAQRAQIEMQSSVSAFANNEWCGKPYVFSETGTNATAGEDQFSNTATVAVA